MKRTLKAKVLRAAWVGTFLTALAATPALAQGMGGGMGYGMGNGPGIWRERAPVQTVDPSSLPDPGSPGARILVRKCTQCHGLVSPGQYTSRQWPDIVEAMGRRMERAAGRGMGMGMGMMGRTIQPLSPGEKTILVVYLQAHAFQPLPPTSQPDEDREKARAFAETCSRCHALPDPTAHSASAWPAVVERMEHYLEKRGGRLTAGQKRAILNYLETNARKE